MIVINTNAIEQWIGATLLGALGRAGTCVFGTCVLARNCGVVSAKLTHKPASASV